MAQVASIEESPSTIGISDSDIYWSGSLDEINERLDLMQSLGVQNVRILVSWANVQPLHPDSPFGLGAPQWSALDRVVNAAAARGMGILGVLNSTPLWASQNLPINGTPKDFNQFADFARSVAMRYGDKISAYEVWNEPNSIQFWNSVSPETYTAMLKVTYTALKQAAAQLGTDITVIGGVVGAGMTLPGGLTMNPVDFIRRMYAAGANGYFDALSFHSYNMEWLFSSTTGSLWQDAPLTQLKRIRAIMDSFLAEGQEQVKIWITEYGLPTNFVSETKQADFIRDLIETWQDVIGAGPIFLYTIKDWLAGAADNPEAHFGIFRPDGTMKPVGQVIKELIEFLTKPPTNPGTGPGTGPGSNPGNGSSAGNPIAAFFKALQGMFNISGLFSAFGSVFTNFLNGIFGIKPKKASTTTTAMRTATADTEAPVDGVEAGTEATTPAVDEVADNSGREDAVVTVPVSDAPAEVPATEVSVEAPVEEAPAEEAPVEEVPVEEVPVEEVPVEEAPVDEVPVDETPAQEAPEQEDEGTAPAEDKPAEDKGDDTTAEDKGDDAEGKKDDAEGKKDDAEFSASPEKHEAVRPNLTARDESTVRTPRGPRTGLKAAREAGQRPAARSNESASASASSGADK